VSSWRHLPRNSLTSHAAQRRHAGVKILRLSAVLPGYFHSAPNPAPPQAPLYKTGGVSHSDGRGELEVGMASVATSALCLDARLDALQVGRVIDTDDAAIVENIVLGQPRDPAAG
jgi:hypothetical protein